MAIKICVAVNDENGRATYDLWGVDFIAQNDIALSLQTAYGDGGACFFKRTYDDRVKISRRSFPVLGYKYYYGNIVHDAFIVTPEIANDIFQYLRSLIDYRCNPPIGKLSPDSGWEEMWNAWKYGSSICEIVAPHNNAMHPNLLRSASQIG